MYSLQPHLQGKYPRGHNGHAVLCDVTDNSSVWCGSFWPIPRSSIKRNAVFLLRIIHLSEVGHFDPYHALRLNVTVSFLCTVCCSPAPIRRRIPYWRARSFDCLGTLGLRWYPHDVIQFSKSIADYCEIVGAVIEYPFTYIPYRKRRICPGISNFFENFKCPSNK
jgi:hypothetical protein